MSRSEHGPIGVRAAAALVVLLLAAAACGGSEGDPVEPAPAGSSTSASPSASAPDDEPSDQATASPDVEPTDPTASSVAPATGPLLEIETLSLSLPTGWEIVSPGSYSEAGFEPGGTGTVAVVGGPTAGSATLDFEADGAFDTATADGLGPQRLDNRTVAGSEGWVITGSSKRLALQYQFGTIVNGNSLVISVSWDRNPPPDAQAIIDSILATVSYRV